MKRWQTSTSYRQVRPANCLPPWGKEARFAQLQYSPNSAAGDWEAAGEDKFFSRSELYNMAWSGMSIKSLRLGTRLARTFARLSHQRSYLTRTNRSTVSLHRIGCANWGGPIASTRDERRVVVVTEASLKPVVKIHSSSGHLLGAFAWERGPIAALGWSAAEELLVVETTGQVFLHHSACSCHESILSC